MTVRTWVTSGWMTGALTAGEETKPESAEVAVALTCWARIFRMFAVPAAMTAAAFAAPTIGPMTGPSSCATEKAVTAPWSMSIVAAAIRRFFALRRSASLAFVSAS